MRVGQWLARNGDLPRIDVELLLAHVLRSNRARIFAFPETPIDNGALGILDALAARLREGEPLAYLTGEREFRDLAFAVDSRVLVPRPDTELLVELALERLAPGTRVLELGTGSGAMAISLKHARPDLDIVATDVSAAALAVARCNARRHGVDLTLIESDWFAGLHGRYGAILSNPPYVRAGDPHLAELGFEPRIALVAGTTGLEAVRAIVPMARAFLVPGAWLLIEHGFDQGAGVQAVFEAAGYTGVTAFADLAGRERATLGYAR